MAEPKKLRPSLLDRLTDDHPEEQHEELGARAMNQEQLRRALLRDMSFLLNTTQLSASGSLDAYPELERSVINFGIPDLAGKTLTTVDPAQLERQLTDVILTFEPRLLRRSLQVRVVAGHTRSGHNGLVFEISAELFSDPLPVAVQLHTEVDLEDGSVRVEESLGRESH